MELVGRLHSEAVARASSDERHARSGDPVGAAHDLLLVTSQTVAQQQQNSVLGRTDLLHACRRLGAGPPQIVALDQGGGRGDRQPRTAERHDDHTGVASPARGYFAGRRASHQGYVGSFLPDTGEQIGKVVRNRTEHHEQLGVRADQRVLGGRRPRSGWIRIG
jgi:hypothetical protein